MKISLKWLADYVNVSEFFAKPKELAQILTAAGLEVESIDDLAKRFDSVVIGHILEKGQHPNADRLSLCQVTTGEGKIHQIVCGAQNHKKDDRVVVALPGAVLPGDFAIKQSKIRGVDSGGMLCSEKELGLKTESEGILILPENAPIGKKFAEYMGFDDIIFELKVTPNRADCLSHFGLAREIACLLGSECKLPNVKLTEGAQSTQDKISLQVLEPELCPRYTGRSVLQVKIAPSPVWLKKRLESVGLKSINNVVDVTNFVMLELGQPLHAFDVRALKGREIRVALAKAGEVFKSLDGTEIKLQGDELTIRDSERVVALAGVVGGQNSGIHDDTTEVFIESAYFSSSSVRKTSRRCGIETDSSYRFSRGVNPEAVAFARDRAANLIQELAGGEVCGMPYDLYPAPLHKPKIEISIDTLTRRLGYKIGASDFVMWMKRLGCEIHELPQPAANASPNSSLGFPPSTGSVVGSSAGSSADSSAMTLAGVLDSGQRYLVQSPMFRWDLNIDMDLVEEFARLHGYQHIPERLSGVDVAPSGDAPSFTFEKRVRHLLKGAGFSQAVNFAFLNDRYQSDLLGPNALLKPSGLNIAEKAIRLKKPAQ